MFANGPGDLSSIPGHGIPKTQKMVLDATLLNTQHYKVRIKGKVEKSRERSSALPIHLGVIAIEKGGFGSPSTRVTNFNFTLFFDSQGILSSAEKSDDRIEKRCVAIFNSWKDNSFTCLKWPSWKFSRFRRQAVGSLILGCKTKRKWLRPVTGW